jgi:hypothetical protein
LLGQVRVRRASSQPRRALALHSLHPEALAAAAARRLVRSFRAGLPNSRSRPFAGALDRPVQGDEVASACAFAGADNSLTCGLAIHAGLTKCNRSITLLPYLASRHSLSSPLGSTAWQTPRFVALWSLGSSGLNVAFSATWSRWATVSPSCASISGPDGACTSRSVVASSLSCWLADPNAHRRATSGARRRWPPY